MAASYIPSKDADLDVWLNNFKTLIAASPTTYGLVTADGTAITNAYNSSHTAYLAAVNPTTRTTATVATKNAQKSIVLTLVRGYAATIRANAAVSDALKMGLGLHVRDTTPTPVPAPSTYPMISVVGMGVGAQSLRASDQLTPSKRSKPTGAAGLLIFRAVAAAPITDPADCTFLAFAGRTELTSSFAPADNGKTATYFARWTNSKGEMGPWSPAASMPIAA
jgi:hypothetical protein